MAWIEFHQSLVTHRKLYALAGKLRVSRPTAAGHLAFLWCWAVDNAPSGDLTDIDPHVIKLAADWPKDADGFVRACIDSGFIDDHNERRTLHDWEYYVGRLIEQRAANAQRMRNARAAQRAAHVQGLPYRTQPNHTQPTVPDQPREGRRRDYIAVENLTGLLNGTTAGLIDEFRGDHPAVSEEWVEAACEEATAQNVRTWKYVMGILKRWERDGFKSDTRPQKGAQRQPSEPENTRGVNTGAGLVVMTLEQEYALERARKKQEAR